MQSEADGKIGFEDCKDDEIKQLFTIIPTDDFVFYKIKSKLMNKAFVFPADLQIDWNIDESLEIFPNNDKGGHYIKSENLDKCLFQDHTKKYPDYDDIEQVFPECDYHERYQTFYFFQDPYIFPEFKVKASFRIIVGLSHYYISPTAAGVYKETFNVLTVGSFVIFDGTEFDNTGEVLPSPERQVSTQIGIDRYRIPNLPLANTDYYYYKTDLPYYFRITECKEDYYYAIWIPIRERVFLGIASRAGAWTASKIYFKRKVKVHTIEGVEYYSSHSCCSGNKTYTQSYSSTYPDRKQYYPGQYLTAVHYARSGGGNLLIDDLYSELKKCDSREDSFVIIHPSFQLNDDKSTYEKFQWVSLTSLRKYYRCYNEPKIKVNYWNDEEITDA